MKKNKKKLKKVSKISFTDIIKANRKGSREAELEVTIGFNSKTKIHKSKKTYNRKKNSSHYDTL